MKEQYSDKKELISDLIEYIKLQNEHRELQKTIDINVEKEAERKCNNNAELYKIKPNKPEEPKKPENPKKPVLIKEPIPITVKISFVVFVINVAWILKYLITGNDWEFMFALLLFPSMFFPVYLHLYLGEEYIDNKKHKEDFNKEMESYNKKIEYASNTYPKLIKQYNEQTLADYNKKLNAYLQKKSELRKEYISSLSEKQIVAKKRADEIWPTLTMYSANVPAKYTYYTDEILEILINDRADTLKEAYNILEQDLANERIYQEQKRLADMEARRSIEEFDRKLREIEYREDERRRQESKDFESRMQEQRRESERRYEEEKQTSRDYGNGSVQCHSCAYHTKGCAIAVQINNKGNCAAYRPKR